MFNTLHVERLAAVCGHGLDDLVDGFDLVSLYAHPQASPQVPICRPAQVLGHDGREDDQLRLLHGQDSMVRQEEAVGDVDRDPGFFRR